MKKKTLIYGTAFIILSPLFLYAQSGRKQVAEGNQLYSEEKFDEANNKYQDAMLEDPGSLPIQFNIGNVLYKKKNYEKSMDAYNKVLDTDDPLFQSQVYYNLGNALFRHGKLPESIVAYEQALKLNPNDLDAKYNLEFVRNQLKQNAQPQQQDSQQQPEQKEQQQPKDKQNQEEQEKDKEEQQQQAEQQEERKEMSKEEAERLLEALKENQKEMKKKQAKGKGKVRVLKDW